MAHLQQIRPDGADDRQQVGDERRLCHALWRYVRRLQRAQRHLQDGSLPSRELAQSDHAGRRAGTERPRHAREHHHAPAVAPNCAPTRPTRIRCRLTKSSTAFSNAWSRRRCRSKMCAPRATIPKTVKRIEHLLYISEYKRRQAPPGVKIGAAQFRPRPALSHHQCFPGCAGMSALHQSSPERSSGEGDREAVEGARRAASPPPPRYARHLPRASHGGGFWLA